MSIDNNAGNGGANNHNVKMSTTVDSVEDQPTTTTTFKPPEIPLGNYCIPNNHLAIWP